MRPRRPGGSEKRPDAAALASWLPEPLLASPPQTPSQCEPSCQGGRVVRGAASFCSSGLPVAMYQQSYPATGREPLNAWT